jgi:hypothetical protein
MKQRLYPLRVVGNRLMLEALLREKVLTAPPVEGIGPRSHQTNSGVHLAIAVADVEQMPAHSNY